MKLFKNVDVRDLKSILDKGILPIKELGHSNWVDGKRANNSEEAVYLFNPLSEVNSFVAYGLILLEVDVDNAKGAEIADNDHHRGMYEEYVVDKVLPKQIKSIYAPEVLKNRIKEELNDEELSELITWVNMDFEMVREFKQLREHIVMPKTVIEDRKATKEEMKRWGEGMGGINAADSRYLFFIKYGILPNKHIKEEHREEEMVERMVVRDTTFQYHI